MGALRYNRLLPSRGASPPREQARGAGGFDCRGFGGFGSYEGANVRLHVYNVTVLSAVEKANAVLGMLGTGAFHAAVEVHGTEWSFGAADDGQTGVFCNPPRACDMHSYRQVLDMGRTSLSEAEVGAVIRRMTAEWQGEDYDLLHCNCCHFSDELCRQLGVGPAPSWVLSLAGAGAKLDDARAAAGQDLGDCKGWNGAAACAGQHVQGVLTRCGSSRGYSRTSFASSMAGAAAKAKSRAQAVLAGGAGHRRMAL